jgi:lipopolysaccharide export system protein LptC
MIWRAFVVLAVLLVGVLSVFIGRRANEPESRAPSNEPPQPGYYINGARIMEMGTDGNALYRLEADSIVQNPGDLSIALEDVKAAYRVESGREWTLTAATGAVPPNSQTIELEGDVRVVGQPEGSRDLGVIRTEKLSLDTQTSIASTPSRVDIEWGARRLSAVGLRADLKAERVQLESAVHGRFVR